MEKGLSSICSIKRVHCSGHWTTPISGFLFSLENAWRKAGDSFGLTKKAVQNGRKAGAKLEFELILREETGKGQ